MVLCCVFGCNSRSASNKKEHQDLSFHKFPRNASIRRSWEMRISRSKENMPSNPVVCSRHFTTESFRGGSYKESLALHKTLGGRRRRELVPTAVPTLFLRGEDNVPKEKHASREARSQKRLVKELMTAGTSGSAQNCNERQSHQSRTSSERSGPVAHEQPSTVTTETVKAMTSQSTSSAYCQTEISLPPHQSLDQLFAFGSYSKPAEPVTVAYDHSYPTTKDSAGPTASSHEQQYMSALKNLPSLSDTHLNDPVAFRVDSDAPIELSGCEEDAIVDDSDNSYRPSDSDQSENDQLDIGSRIKVVDDLKFVLFSCQLNELLKRCQECGASILDCSYVTQGSCITVTGSCSNYHDFQWTSSPKIGQMPASNLMLSAAILFSGSAYASFRQAFEFMNIAIHTEQTHMRIQSSHLFPVVHRAWMEEEAAAIERSKQYPTITLLGDGRCDSPGFSAKYGTYTMMDATSSNILTFKLVQVTEAGSSVGMEKVGFQHCLDKLLQKKVPVSTVATDRHVSITALMGNGPKGEPRYKDIDHQYDVWHLAKSVKKRLRAAAKKKGCEKLEMWMQSLSNHLWWCAASCEGDSANLVDRWLSIVHHVANHHEWGGDSTFTKCGHQDLSHNEARRVKWLIAGSTAHNELVKVVTNKRIVSDIRKLNSFCHTGELETYHSMMTKYVPKRKHFSYHGMYVRTALAALDHNHSIDRHQAVTRSGAARFSTVCPKSHQRWIARPIKVAKSYDHIKDLMIAVVKQKENTKASDELALHLPKQAKNIAKSMQPPKEDVVARHRSRFQKQ